MTDAQDLFSAQGVKNEDMPSYGHTKFHLGVDPGGSSGAIAAIKDTGVQVLVMWVMEFKKHTMQEICREIARLQERGPVQAVVEKVHAMPKQGVSSTFKFGQNFGEVQGILMALDVPFVLKTPHTWMKHFGLKKNKSEGDSEYKRRIRKHAAQVYAGFKIANANQPDALMIAKYSQEEVSL